jgi:hypothetical protein
MVTGCKMAVASVPVTTITSGAWATSSAARRERPRRRRAAEHRDELAPLHSITSSAQYPRFA